MQTKRFQMPMIARILLGAVFTIFGLNGFLGFMPQPALPDAAGSFMGALAATGYMFPLIKGTEVLAGLLLLGNRLVPLALVLLAPITVNIVAFHLFLAPGAAGMLMPLFIVALELVLAWHYREVFRPLFQGTRREAQASKPARAAMTPQRAT